MLLFVEGGGVHRDTEAKCRKGFRDFIENAGMMGNMPRIVSCGSRNIAFEKYREAVLDGKEAVLLVDSVRPKTVNLLNLQVKITVFKLEDMHKFVQLC